MSRNIVLSYTFSQDSKLTNHFIHNELITILDLVHTLGSLSAVAKEIGISYRHLWNEINRWENEFKEPLLIRERGKACELSAFGNRLLWAEKEVQAKYATQIAELRAGIEQAYAKAIDTEAKIISLRGCSDEAVRLFRDDAIQNKLYLELSFNSSLQGLKDLQDNKCHIAGFNFPLGATSSSKAAKTFSTYLSKDIKLIGFATRIQGMAVARGNPLSLHSFLDLSLKKAIFINRNEGSGTRVLCDELMTTSGLTSKDINGYENTVNSHALVAASVASGKADAGLCVQSIASHMNLDFVPMVKEIYYFATRDTFLKKEETKKFIQILNENGWLEKASSLEGYDFRDCGKIYDISHLGWNLSP